MCSAVSIEFNLLGLDSHTAMPAFSAAGIVGNSVTVGIAGMVLTLAVVVPVMEPRADPAVVLRRAS